MARPRWILELHDEFPSADDVRLRVPDPLVVSRQDLLLGRPEGLQGPQVGYGTMTGMAALARHSTAVFDDFASLRCSSYYRRLYDLLGRACVLAPFTALKHLPLERMFGSRVFVRSDSNFKLFPASVLSVEEIPRWMDFYQTHQDELLVLSDVVELKEEFRCVCRRGRFVCGSSYPEPPYSPVPERVRAFAEKAARRLAEAGISMCTVDVGIGPGGLYLVEAGGVNSWGVYGSDLDAFIESMEKEAMQVAEDWA